MFSCIKVQLNSKDTKINIPKDKLKMYSNTTEKSKMDTNVRNLQYVLDKVSEAGGGLITIKAGSYYMTVGGSCIDSSTKRTKHYCIYPKDNVTIAGTRGQDGDLLTTLLPYGAEDNGITMFLFDSRASNNVRLTNADFRTDGINAKHTGKFQAQGKGFAFDIVRDCDWYNVEVQNTNGTGFGMDELINFSVKNCSANACGNYGLNRPENEQPKVGASGFGIGYGYTADESISITYCLATNNKRFGIFFECQGRFNPDRFKYTVVEKLEASNNICAGNTYNMGGECCFNSRFTNNISEVNSEGYEYPNLMNVKNNNVHYYFGKTDKVKSKDNIVTFPNGIFLNLPEYKEDEIL